MSEKVEEEEVRFLVLRPVGLEKTTGDRKRAEHG